MLSSLEVRQSFLDFFVSKGHKIVRSASIVPYKDPTLLFTNAGMNQFKDVFLEQGSRPYTRAVNSQKCIRASGKHNDLDDVGFDTYHHTFFEMLGNWSFGDYGKEEIIRWSWELLTEVWKIPKERLYVTIYEKDSETGKLWESHTDIHPSRILTFGKAHNFWEMGTVGPCGSCSEVHMDLTEDLSGASLVNQGSSDLIELWNLVFIEYNRTEKGDLEPLPKKHIDTGMGFERITSILQKKKSNYDSDIFSPLFNHLSEISSHDYKGSYNKKDTAFRVIADHVRTLTFAISDGVTPSNEGRGYILRRILRRGAKFATSLNIHEPLIYKLAPTLASQMKHIYPEIEKNISSIQTIIKGEEETFLKTLDRGLDIFSSISKATLDSSNRTVSGQDAFRLYDTFGFPLDLTLLLAKEKNLAVDTGGFEELMLQQKNRARIDRKKKQIGKQALDPTKWISLANGSSSTFTGYDKTSEKTFICDLATKDQKIHLTLDKTPFYAESGGQLGDAGYIETDIYRLFVADTQSERNRIIHIVDHVLNLETNQPISIPSIDLSSISASCNASIDLSRRAIITIHHTATHLLHSALREVIGKHVQQKGSLVSANKLRFDFNHPSQLSDKELTDIELLINQEIRKNTPVTIQVDVPFSDAKRIGALSFFGDKYGDLVRVIQIGDFSIELCGGTHTSSLGEIGHVKLLSDSSISSGTRRIEAIAGTISESLFRHEHNLIARVKKKLGVHQDITIEEKIDYLSQAYKKAKKESDTLRLDILKHEVEKYSKQAVQIRDASFIGSILDVHNPELLKLLVIWARLKYPTSIIFLASNMEGKASISIGVGKDIHGRFNAVKLISKAAFLIQGGGGGNQDIATAGGKDPSKLKEAIQAVENFLRSNDTQEP